MQFCLGDRKMLKVSLHGEVVIAGNFEAPETLEIHIDTTKMLID